MTEEEMERSVTAANRESNADGPSAVSQIADLRGAELSGDVGKSEDPADQRSAIRQAGSLRYELAAAGRAGRLHAQKKRLGRGGTMADGSRCVFRCPDRTAAGAA